MLKHQRSGISFFLPCSIWGCLLYCWRQSGRLSYQTVCGPHTLPSQSRYKTIGGRTLINLNQSQHQQDRSRTCLHESCYPRLLAVAVVEEGHLPLLHLPHEITRLWSEVTRSAPGHQNTWGLFWNVSVRRTNLKIPNAIPAAGLVRHSLQILDPELKGEADPWVHSYTLKQSRARFNIPSRRCRSGSGSRARTSSASGWAVEAHLHLLAP